jgi:multicomponent K+:H+ antiporter subunit C
VLTAIVIGFGTTALLLVLLLALRALTGTDHVDGRDAGTDARNRSVEERP